MKKVRWIFLSLLFGLLVGSISTWFVAPRYPQEPPILNIKPWFDISPETKSLVTSRFQVVTANGSQCSGCMIKNGYTLTAQHCLGDLTKNPVIAVNGQRARLISDPISNQTLDLAVLSIFANIDKRSSQIDQYNSFSDNQDIIIVGSPGKFSILVQPGKILTDAIDEHTKKVITDTKVISTQYVEKGISGGCIYSRDGNTLLGIVTKKYDHNSSLGQATFVSKPIE